MTIRQVLLNGSGTSGDGTTWNDASDATSAYIGSVGLGAAVNASAAGDIVYVKGTDTTSATAVTLGVTPTLAYARNPVKVYGCIAATTNNQGSIVASDLVPGLRNGSATRAYDQTAGNAAPVVEIAGNSPDITIKHGYYYGLVLGSQDNVIIANNVNALVTLEECEITATHGTGDSIWLATGGASRVITKNSKLSLASGAYYLLSNGFSEHYGTVLNVPGTTAIFGNSSTNNILGHHEFHGCDLSGGETTIFQRLSGAGNIFLYNCKFPASWVLTGGTAIGQYKVVNFGSDDTAGLTTGGSEQQLNIETHHGTIVTETTKVRTGGADDGAAGLFSLDMSTFTNGTVPGIAGLSVKCAPIWVAGDGTSKNIEIYFTSDSGNTRGTDWNDDEVWGIVLYPDDAGTSQYDYQSTVADLLATGSAVTDDTGSTWGAGTQNDQKIVFTLSPDYEGYVIPEIFFAPGTNAETIYADPQPVVT